MCQDLLLLRNRARIPGHQVGRGELRRPIQFAGHRSDHAEDDEKRRGRRRRPIRLVGFAGPLGLDETGPVVRFPEFLQESSWRLIGLSIYNCGRNALSCHTYNTYPLALEQLEYEDVAVALDFALGRCFEDEVQTVDEEAGGVDEDLEFSDHCCRVGPFEPEDVAGRPD